MRLCHLWERFSRYMLLVGSRLPPIHKCVRFYPYLLELMGHSQRGTVVPISPDPRSPGATVEQSAYAQAIREREPLMASLKSGVASATLRLLVAVCALLTHADHHTLGPVLWSQFLDEPEPCIVAPVSGNDGGVYRLLNTCLLGLLLANILSREIPWRFSKAHRN